MKKVLLSLMAILAIGFLGYVMAGTPAGKSTPTHNSGVSVSTDQLAKPASNKGDREVLYDDDFESYTVGQGIALQNSTWWTTWSNAPSGPEDPLVSNAQSSSPTKSIVVQGTNDGVLLLGDKTEGVYHVSFKAFIPTGKFGYYNLLQDFAGANSLWGMQAFFDAGGVGSIDAGGQGAGSFTYQYDTWIDVENIVNIDLDLAEVWINGQLIVTWQWSLGSFGQTGGVNKLDAANFYAWADNGTPGAHFDDITFEKETAGPNYLYEEDFESYIVGQGIALQNSTWWTTWSAAPGGPEDPLVSNAQSYSTSKSIVVNGLNDGVLLLGDKTSGKYSVEFYMYVPSGNVGYYNVLQDFAGANSIWGLEIYFNPGGVALITANGTAGISQFTYPYNTWFLMENVIDLDSDLATIRFEGTDIYSWQWSVGASGGGINQLSAVDFYAATTNGTPITYYDDIAYYEVENQPSDPTITVDPTSMTQNLDPGQTATQILTIGNTGGALLNFDIMIEYPSKGATAQRATKDNLGAVNTEVVLSSDPATPASYTTHGNAPESTDDEVILNYDGENNDAIGLTNGGTMYVAAMFPSSMVGQYNGMDLVSVDIYINDAPTSAALMIWAQGTPNAPGTLLHQQDMTPNPLSWNTITLTSPVAIDGTDIWVGYQVTHTAGTYCAGTDAGPAALNGDWISTNGTSWAHLAGYGLNYNWNIRAKLTGTPTPLWLTASTMTGTVIPGGTVPVTFNFNANQMSVGTYVATVKISSNDPVNPMITVPVTMIVGEEPPMGEVVLDFEDLDDFALTFGDWTAIDVDQGDTYSISGYEFPNQNMPMSYIVFNPAMTTPPMTEPAIMPHGGAKFGACFASVPPPFNNDWLISPQIQLGDNSVLQLWVKSYTADYGLEKYKIGVSTTTPSPANFTIISGATPLQAPATAWEEKTFDLSMYDGQLVYVGIQCVSEDAFIFMVDDIVVSYVTGINDNPANMNSILVYPNPVQGMMNLSVREEMTNIQVINFTGQEIINEAVTGKTIQINTSTWAKGVYVIKAETASGTFTKKVVVE